MVGRISARGLWVNIAGKSVCVPQPQGGVGSFPRARARSTYLWLAYEGDGRSISRNHGRQWRRDDESAWNQFYALLILSIRNLTAIQRTVDTFTTEILTVLVSLRGGLLGVKTPFFLAIKIRAPLKGPFRGLFGTGPTFTVRGPGNELGASKVQKRATLRPPSAC